MAFTPAQVEQLLRPVNPRRVQRDNHGMSHLAAYDVSAHLTRIFGFGGWSKRILALELVAEDGIMDTKRNRLGWWVTYRCTMRLQVGSWWNEDGATGSAENLPERGDAHDFALKNAISYALKRCAKDLGDQFGLSLYNKGSVAPLIGRTLAHGPVPPGKAAAGSPAAVDSDLPDLAPDWDEAPPGRADGLPTNRDGSLSRSQTTDAQKEQAGVMTAAQQAEHTGLGGGHPGERKTPKDERGGVVRIRSTPAGTAAAGSTAGPGLNAAAPPADPWLDQPAGSLPDPEHKPGTITPAQQRAIMKRYESTDRAVRLQQIGAIVGREVTSTNELSYVDAQLVLGKAKAAAT